MWCEGASLTYPLSFWLLGLAPKNADDGMPFTSILYANGPGYVHVNGTRENITTVDYSKYLPTHFGSCTHLIREILWSDWCLAFFPWKGRRNWCLWYSFHCSLISSLLRPHCIHVRHLKRAICLSLWTAVLQSLLPFVPHRCLSQDGNTSNPPMNCCLKPTILSF